jgi:hypothetical protein
MGYKEAFIVRKKAVEFADFVPSRIPYRRPKLAAPQRSKPQQAAGCAAAVR